jgi:type I restriction enzyme S subunit
MQDKPAVVMGTGGVASVNYGYGQFSYSTDTWAFRSNIEDYSTEFLYRKIQENLSKIDYAGFEGSGLRHLRKDFVKSLLVDMPEPSKAKKITKILSAFDQNIEKTESLIEKYQQIKAGLMHDLFTRGVTTDGKLRPTREQAPELYQETLIGWIPRDWNVSSLGEISEIVRGSTPRPAKDPRYFDGEYIPWITVGELSKEDWPYLNNTRTMLTELGSSFSRKLAKGTLVISNSGYGCGVPKILNLTGCANDGVAAFLNLDSECDKLYLYYYLYSQIMTLRKKVARGNDQPNLNTDMLGDFQVALPPRDEQKRISERLWEIEKLIKSEKKYADKLAVQKSGLMNDLLSGKVNVNSQEPEAVNV